MAISLVMSWGTLGDITKAFSDIASDVLEPVPLVGVAKSDIASDVPGLGLEPGVGEERYR